MRFTVTGRRMGKTQKLLDWMRAAPEGEHRVGVFDTPQDAMRVYRETFDEAGEPTWGESWQFVSLDEIRAPGAMRGVLRGRGGTVVVGMDNIDLILQSLSPFQVEFVTATGIIEEAT